MSQLLAIPIALTADQVIGMSASIAALSAVASALIALVPVRRAGASNREAVEALEIPFLIPDPGISDHHRLKFEDAEAGSLRIPLRNVGMGPAILGDVQFVIDERQILAQAGGQDCLPGWGSAIPSFSASQLQARPRGTRGAAYLLHPCFGQEVSDAMPTENGFCGGAADEFPSAAVRRQ